MKKQGFTLIELMVVIVIMGILAAVAVPKLFGQIAKSKASEVATNAAAYKTALDAYVVTEAKVGDHSAIGYDLPGNNGNTGNFTYGTTAEVSNGIATWSATSNVGLNNCTSGSTWVLKGSYTSSTGKMAYSIEGTAWRNDACKALTPGFDKLSF